MMGLGEKIYRLRTEHNMTQEQLAERLGVSRQSISKWESGAATPELEKVRALAEVFSVSVDELLGNPAKEQPSSNLQRSINRLRTWCVALTLVCAILLVSLIGCYMSLKDQISDLSATLAGTGPQIIYPPSDTEDDISQTFSSWNWHADSVDTQAKTAVFTLSCTPKNLRESTTLSAKIQCEGMDTISLEMPGENGIFSGTVSLPWDAELSTLTVCLNTDGDLQNVILLEDMPLMYLVTWLPCISPYPLSSSSSLSDQVHLEGSIDIWSNDTYDLLSSPLANRVRDLKITISRDGKTCFSEDNAQLSPDEAALASGESSRIRYSFDMDKTSYEENTAFDITISFTDTHLSRTVTVTYPVDFSTDKGVSLTPQDSGKVEIR